MKLIPGWYKLRNHRRMRISISNFQQYLGYESLAGNVWSSKDKMFISHGVWSLEGVSSLGRYYDILGCSNPPSNFPNVSILRDFRKGCDCDCCRNRSGS